MLGVHWNQYVECDTFGYLRFRSWYYLLVMYIISKPECTGWYQFKYIYSAKQVANNVFDIHTSGIRLYNNGTKLFVMRQYDSGGSTSLENAYFLCYNLGTAYNISTIDDNPRLNDNILPFISDADGNPATDTTNNFVTLTLELIN